MLAKKVVRRNAIRKRIRRSLMGTNVRPRLSVFRSNKEIYAQVIDDASGNTIVAASSKKEAAKSNKTEQAVTVGKVIAEKTLALGITDVVFDRSGYLYHGRVKALADSARNAGLKF